MVGYDINNYQVIKLDNDHLPPLRKSFMICLKNLSGTCETSSECSTDGGSADGTCAAGFGVCCVFFFFSFVVIALCSNSFKLVYFSF